MVSFLSETNLPNHCQCHCHYYHCLHLGVLTGDWRVLAGDWQVLAGDWQVLGGYLDQLALE